MAHISYFLIVLIISASFVKTDNDCFCHSRIDRYSLSELQLYLHKNKGLDVLEFVLDYLLERYQSIVRLNRKKKVNLPPLELLGQGVSPRFIYQNQAILGNDNSKILKDQKMRNMKISLKDTETTLLFQDVKQSKRVYSLGGQKFFMYYHPTQKQGALYWSVRWSSEENLFDTKFSKEDKENKKSKNIGVCSAYQKLFFKQKTGQTIKLKPEKSPYPSHLPLVHQYTFSHYMGPQFEFDICVNFVIYLNKLIRKHFEKLVVVDKFTNVPVSSINYFLTNKKTGKCENIETNFSVFIPTKLATMKQAEIKTMITKFKNQPNPIKKQPTILKDSIKEYLNSLLKEKMDQDKNKSRNKPDLDFNPILGNIHEPEIKIDNKKPILAKYNEPIFEQDLKTPTSKNDKTPQSKFNNANFMTPEKFKQQLEQGSKKSTDVIKKTFEKNNDGHFPNNKIDNPLELAPKKQQQPIKNYEQPKNYQTQREGQKPSQNISIKVKKNKNKPQKPFETIFEMDGEDEDLSTKNEAQPIHKKPEDLLTPSFDNAIKPVPFQLIPKSEKDPIQNMIKNNPIVDMDKIKDLPKNHFDVDLKEFKEKRGKSVENKFKQPQIINLDKMKENPQLIEIMKNIKKNQTPFKIPTKNSSKTLTEQNPSSIKSPDGIENELSFPEKSKSNDQKPDFKKESSNVKTEKNDENIINSSQKTSLIQNLKSSRSSFNLDSKKTASFSKQNDIDEEIPVQKITKTDISENKIVDPNFKKEAFSEKNNNNILLSDKNNDPISFLEPNLNFNDDTNRDPKTDFNPNLKKVKICLPKFNFKGIVYYREKYGSLFLKEVHLDEKKINSFLQELSKGNIEQPFSVKSQNPIPKTSDFSEITFKNEDFSLKSSIDKKSEKISSEQKKDDKSLTFGKNDMSLISPIIQSEKKESSIENDKSKKDTFNENLKIHPSNDKSSAQLNDNSLISNRIESEKIFVKSQKKVDSENEKPNPIIRDLNFSSLNNHKNDPSIKPHFAKSSENELKDVEKQKQNPSNMKDDPLHLTLTPEDVSTLSENKNYHKSSINIGLKSNKDPSINKDEKQNLSKENSSRMKDFLNQNSKSSAIVSHEPLKAFNFQNQAQVESFENSVITDRKHDLSKDPSLLSIKPPKTERSQSKLTNFDKINSDQSGPKEFILNKQPVSNRYNEDKFIKIDNRSRFIYLPLKEINSEGTRNTNLRGTISLIAKKSNSKQSFVDKLKEIVDFQEKPSTKKSPFHNKSININREKINNDKTSSNNNIFKDDQNKQPLIKSENVSDKSAIDVISNVPPIRKYIELMNFAYKTSSSADEVLSWHLAFEKASKSTSPIKKDIEDELNESIFHLDLSSIDSEESEQETSNIFEKDEFSSFFNNSNNSDDEDEDFDSITKQEASLFLGTSKKIAEKNDELSKTTITNKVSKLQSNIINSEPTIPIEKSDFTKIHTHKKYLKDDKPEQVSINSNDKSINSQLIPKTIVKNPFLNNLSQQSQSRRSHSSVNLSKIDEINEKLQKQKDQLSKKDSFQTDLKSDTSAFSKKLKNFENSESQIEDINLTFGENTSINKKSNIANRNGFLEESVSENNPTSSKNKKSSLLEKYTRPNQNVFDLTFIESDSNVTGNHYDLDISKESKIPFSMIKSKSEYKLPLSTRTKQIIDPSIINTENDITGNHYAINLEDESKIDQSISYPINIINDNNKKQLSEINSKYKIDSTILNSENDVTGNHYDINISKQSNVDRTFSEPISFLNKIENQIFDNKSEFSLENVSEIDKSSLSKNNVSNRKDFPANGFLKKHLTQNIKITNDQLDLLNGKKVNNLNESELKEFFEKNRLNKESKSSIINRLDLKSTIKPLLINNNIIPENNKKKIDNNSKIDFLENKDSSKLKNENQNFEKITTDQKSNDNNLKKVQSSKNQDDLSNVFSEKRENLNKINVQENVKQKTDLIDNFNLANLKLQNQKEQNIKNELIPNKIHRISKDDDFKRKGPSLMQLDLSGIDFITDEDLNTSLRMDLSLNYNRHKKIATKAAKILNGFYDENNGEELIELDDSFSHDQSLFDSDDDDEELDVEMEEESDSDELQNKQDQENDQLDESLNSSRLSVNKSFRTALTLKEIKLGEDNAKEEDLIQNLFKSNKAEISNNKIGNHFKTEITNEESLKIQPNEMKISKMNSNVDKTNIEKDEILTDTSTIIAKKALVKDIQSVENWDEDLQTQTEILKDMDAMEDDGLFRANSQTIFKPIFTSGKTSMLDFEKIDHKGNKLQKGRKYTLNDYKEHRLPYERKLRFCLNLINHFSIFLKENNLTDKTDWFVIYSDLSIRFSSMGLMTSIVNSVLATNQYRIIRSRVQEVVDQYVVLTKAEMVYSKNDKVLKIVLVNKDELPSIPEKIMKKVIDRHVEDFQKAHPHVSINKIEEVSQMEVD